jgi:hypothetical protein
LSAQLKLIARVKDVVDIKRKALEQLAITRIRAGKVVPGYIIEENLGDRTWKPFVTPEVFQLLAGIEVTEKKMRSPAQVEKLLGKNKDVIKDLVDRHFIGHKLKQKDCGDLGNKIFGKQSPEIKIAK